MSYLSNVRTNLTRPREELNARHPFLRAQSCFARKVVQVRHESLQNVLEPWVRVQRVDPDHVLGDVVDRQVHQRRDLDLRGIHFVYLFCMCAKRERRLGRCVRDRPGRAIGIQARQARARGDVNCVAVLQMGKKK